MDAGVEHLVRFEAVSNHHSLPVFIQKGWATPDAALLIDADQEAQAGARAAFDAHIAAGRSRKMQVCVLDKRTGQLRAAPTGKVCCREGLYALEPPGSTSEAHAAAHVVAAHVRGHDLEARTTSELLEVGSEPPDAETVEAVRFGNIDGAFASLLPVLRSAGRLDLDQIRIVLRFLAFAWVRTESWLEQHAPTATGRAVAESTAKIRADPGDRTVADRPVAARLLSSMDDTIKSNPMAVLPDEMEGVFRSWARVSVLRAPRGGPLFVQCDNPARPFRRDRLRSLANEPISSLLNPKTLLAYPISPRTCLVMPGGARRGTWGGRLRRSTAGAGAVRQINTGLAIHANREIILPGPTTEGLFQDWLDVADIPSHRM